MEDSQLSDTLAIKSSIRDYTVYFSESIEKDLFGVFRPGDFIILDQLVLDLNPGINSIVKKFGSFIAIEASENTKSYEGIIPFIENLIQSGFKRNNRLIAIGGGITQDVTAFIASIIYRGVDWIFFPTTLLAQSDSCIGSKTSINFRKFKNQLGNFYPPLSIHLDPNMLQTLENRDIRSGVGEMAHYFFVSGPNDVDFFEREFRTALDSQTNLKDVIKASLTIKKRYIEVDEFDKKERLVFNYGHTFGHAIESITNYAIPHGVAVSFGMDMANYISFRKGYISLEQMQHANEIFREIWNGYSIGGMNLQDLVVAMQKDKKNENGMLGLILTKGWGKMFKDLTPPDNKFTEWLKDYMNTFQN